MVSTLLLSLLVAGAPVSMTPETEFIALEKVWNVAHVQGDAAALEGLWASDLVVIVPKMPPLTRDDAVSMARSGKIKFSLYDTSAIRVRLHGETAIVTGVMDRERERSGEPVHDHWQFTKVYCRQDGKWRVVAFHASEAP